MHTHIRTHTHTYTHTRTQTHVRDLSLLLNIIIRLFLLTDNIVDNNEFDHRYGDGYKTLAAAQGMSSTGLAVEPCRMDGAFNKSCLVIVCVFDYAGIASDLTTMYAYSADPVKYARSWFVLMVLFFCTPIIFFDDVLFGLALAVAS